MFHTLKACATFRLSSRGVQSLLEIVFDVGDVFNAYRYAHVFGGDAGFAAQP